jgi:hypothetical protein
MPWIDFPLGPVSRTPFDLYLGQQLVIPDPQYRSTVAYVEDGRVDGRIMILAVRLVNDRWTLPLLRAVFAAFLPRTTDVDPSRLLQRLHSFMSTVFSRGGGVADAAAVLLDPQNHFGYVSRAGEYPPLLIRSPWGWLGGASGPRLGRPDGRESDPRQIFPQEQLPILMHGETLLIVSPGLIGAVACTPPHLRFGADSASGLIPLLVGLQRGGGADAVVTCVFNGLGAFCGGTLQGDAMAIAVHLT